MCSFTSFIFNFTDFIFNEANFIGNQENSEKYVEKANYMSKYLCRKMEKITV